MATFSDVQNALRDFAAAIVYPNGEGNPSVAGVGIRIEKGWPISADLDKRLSTGKALISIYQPTGMEQNVTRFFPEWQPVSINAATLTLTISGNTTTVGGTITAGEIAIVIVNNNTANPYGYTVLITDTLDTIAAALAALIPNASSVGAIITVANAYNLIGRVSTQGNLIREEKRQTRVFWLIIWSPTPDIRELIADALDIAIPLNPYLTLADGTGARLLYKSVADRDDLSKVQTFRRDFNVSVEYATTQADNAYTIENLNTPITELPNP